MSFRTRMLLVFAPLTVLPLALFAFGIRRTVDRQLTSQYEDRVAATAAVVKEDLEREGRLVASRLDALAAGLADDNRFRAAVIAGQGADRSWLLERAAEAMDLAGLSVLQIQDTGGRILSSGHFRNDFDRIDAALPPAIEAAPGGVALAEFRTPTGTVLALAHVARVRIGVQMISLVGGMAVDPPFLRRLSRGGDPSVVLVHPAGTMSGDERAGETARDAGAGPPGGGKRGAAGPPAVTREFPVPFVGEGGNAGGDARFVVRQSLEPLVALRRSIDAWFLGGLVAMAIVALWLASWASARVSRPLTELARRTSRLDLDTLDVDFSSRRTDEIGKLSRLLGAMTERMRASVARLRDAERRATVGELARQVNHDVRNGLTPIRNVVRHLAELARDSPEELPAVFVERQGTLDSSIAYLHSLATNYARLSPPLERQPCDVNAVARDVLRNAPPERDGQRFEADLAPALPAVVADPVALRRILENLVVNAIESLEGRPGTVIVGTRSRSTGDGARVEITVTDTGHGMTPEQLAKAFDDFWSTRERGSGLGLSIVRRLVADADGAVRVDSEAGRGTKFTVTLPAAAAVGDDRAASAGGSRARAGQAGEADA